MTTAIPGIRCPRSPYAASSEATRSNIASATERPSRILARPSTAAIPPALTSSTGPRSRGFRATETTLPQLLPGARGRLLDLTEALVRLGEDGIGEAAICDGLQID